MIDQQLSVVSFQFSVRSKHRSWLLKRSKLLLFFIGFLLIQSVFGQYTIPEKPKLQTSVYDYVNLLSPSQKSALEQKLIRYSDSTSTQIVVAIISRTEGEDVGFLATNWAHKWGIGQKGKDNGVFILVAKDDRRLSIQTGYGVEHLLTDYTTTDIRVNIITPEFKKGDYYTGLDKGSDAIFKVLKGEFKGGKKLKKKTNSSFFRIIPIIFFIILFIILSNKNNRGGKGGKRRSGFSILDAIILSSAGRGFGGGGSFGGSSGGSFGGGGFGGGFGGGGFGGGGSSGGW
ncbi:hypothetical protein KCTC32516_00421 [Polaribacter huanghezhanensis]|uniref:TPM domain-containing protein n=1 Tax=Polaribacter huanghezhanensis TaxID=1354726 RepID=UPI00264A33A8|nr:TPM domain-containing protein [Polaribacter huanghezhanensis]WKD85082.1 hypothetical protein KCTC32516_00421 [Polaribacter huanghezhanensis]